MFIPILPSRLAQFELAARAQHAERGTSLASSREGIARAAGFRDWPHLEACARHTLEVGHPDADLPPILAEYLGRAAEDIEIPDDAVAAFEDGLVFVLDGRLADEAPDPPDCIRADALWPLAAVDAWRVTVQSTEEDEVPLAERLDPEALLAEVQAQSAEWRLFRHIGETAILSLEQAFAEVFADLPGAPLWIWMHGAFIDPYAVRPLA